VSKIDRNEIYDKNLNFLIGSGASFGVLPTLALPMQDSETGKSASLEVLATRFEENEIIRSLLFSRYVKEVICPAAEFDLTAVPVGSVQEEAINNYEQFLTTILSIIGKKSNQKKANIFTTNYDGLVAHVAEEMSRAAHFDFVLNDGGSGFIRRTLFAKNFNRFYRDQGVFDRHSTDIAQINLMQLHGSVYWYKQGESIEIAYSKKRAVERVAEVPLLENDDFTSILEDETKNETSLEDLKLDEKKEDISEFWKAYRELPIVNPTKWKFHETVFEEHYYQMLRLLSYELEKPDTVFISFGFSFADEHILNLVKRSLSNPSLQMFVCCFDDFERGQLQDKFQGFSNVELISVDGLLDFTTFNKEVLTVSSNSSGSEE